MEDITEADGLPDYPEGGCAPLVRPWKLVIKCFSALVLYLEMIDYDILAVHVMGAELDGSIRGAWGC